MTAYIGHILSLLGASLGLAGDTWDHERKGLQKLTTKGRLALAIIAVGFIISVSSTYSERAKNARLQRSASTEIEKSWRALVYPFTLMLWEVQGSAVGYDLSELEALLDPEVQEQIREIDLFGEAPHHAGSWLSVLSNSSSNGKQALLAARPFYPMLDDGILLATQEVLDCYYLEVLVGSDSFISKLRSDPHWIGRPYPVENLSDFKGAQRYIDSLLELRRELDRHLPEHEDG